MKNDRKSAILIFVLTAVMVYFTLQLPQSTMEGEPGPAFFPLILLGLMALCAVFLFFSKPKEKVPELSEEELKKYEELGMEMEDEEEESKELSLTQGMILFGLFLIGIILMYFFGYVVGINGRRDSSWDCIYSDSRTYLQYSPDPLSSPDFWVDSCCRYFCNVGNILRRDDRWFYSGDFTGYSRQPVCGGDRYRRVYAD